MLIHSDPSSSLDSSSDQPGHDGSCKHCKKGKVVVFSWGRFFSRITSPSFLVWLSWAVTTFVMTWRDGEHSWLDLMMWGNIIISALIVCGETVIDAIAEAIRKADIKVDL